MLPLDANGAAANCALKVFGKVGGASGGLINLSEIKKLTSGRGT